MFTLADFSKYLEHLEHNIAFTCSTCQTVMCLACGEHWQPHEDRIACARETSSIESTASWSLLHCRFSISVVLGVGLTHVERLLGDSVESTEQEASVSSARATKKRKRGSSSRSQDTSYVDHSSCDEDDRCGHCPLCHELKVYFGTTASTSHRPGTGYAGGFNDDYSWQRSATEAQREKDKSISRALGLLRAYLPDENRSHVRLKSGELAESGPSKHDHLCDITVLAHLRRRFLPIASTLLEPQSISDVTERLPVFKELLAWLVLLSQHCSTAALIAQPIMRLTRIEISSGTKKGIKSGLERRLHYAAAPSPRELAQTVSEQASVLIKSIKRSLQPREEQKDHKAPILQDTARHQEEEVLKLCESLVNGVAGIDRALARVKGRAFVNNLLSSMRQRNACQTEDDSRQSEGVDTLGNVEEAYSRWAKRVIYEEADLSILAKKGEAGPRKYQHKYAKEIEASSSFSSSQRNLTISKELAGMSECIRRGSL